MHALGFGALLYLFTACALEGPTDALVDALDGAGQKPRPAPLAYIGAEVFPALIDAPPRLGERPRVTFRIPHMQLDQPAPLNLQDELLQAIEGLPGVRIDFQQSACLDGCRVWILEDDNQGRSFGHLHRPDEGSMHLFLPAAAAGPAIEKGWAILHPFSASITGGRKLNYLLLFAPRDRRDLANVWLVVQAAYRHARDGLD